LNRSKITDQKVEVMISILLRAGVLLSGAIVLAGGLYYLVRHGSEATDYHTFHGQPSVDRIVYRIIAGAFALRARSIIQTGILLLIATPIARVAFSLVAFTLQRDSKYVLITTIVLAVLLYSLISGAVQG
jgi:uncharacterized membrane protein